MRGRGTGERGGAQGFTLLELSLAMAILGMIAAMCYGAFHLGVRAVERGEVAVVTAQRLRVASDVLIRQVKSVVAYPARNEDEEVYPYFMGTATSMTFVTATGLQGGGGLVQVVYQVGDDPPRLCVSENRYVSPDALGRDAVDDACRTGTTLLDNFRDLKFEYLMNDGVETEWRQAWDGHEEEMLPSAVRILVDGMPGLEMDAWGQEIPVMTTAYGGFTGELDDDDLLGGDENDEIGPVQGQPTGQPNRGVEAGEDEFEPGEDD